MVPVIPGCTFVAATVVVSVSPAHLPEDLTLGTALAPFDDKLDTMVLLRSFFNLFLTFSAPSIQRNVQVETLNIRLQKIHAPTVISRTSQRIGVQSSLFLANNQKDSVVDRVSLQALNQNQLCGLLEHCQLPDVKKFVTDNQLTGLSEHSQHTTHYFVL